MITLRDAIAPKSDQLNYDDVMSSSITVQVTGVRLVGGEQPVCIDIGEANRPYKPCKSMLRVLVAVWGDDETQWTGRYMTLYGDPAVKWAGKEVGGIRISHLSHLTSPFNVALTAAKGKRMPFTVQPLQAPQDAKQPTRAEKCREWLESKGIAVSDAEAMIGKSLTEATEADFSRIGKMKAGE